jgi:hypothetical protein
MEKDLTMGIFGILLSGTLTAAILTYMLDGTTGMFFTIAFVACFFTDMLFNTNDTKDEE